MGGVRTRTRGLKEVGLVVPPSTRALPLQEMAQLLRDARLATQKHTRFFLSQTLCEDLLLPAPSLELQAHPCLQGSAEGKTVKALWALARVHVCVHVHVCLCVCVQAPPSPDSP